MKAFYPTLIKIVLVQFLCLCSIAIFSQELVPQPKIHTGVSMTIAPSTIMNKAIKNTESSIIDGSLGYGNNVWTNDLYSFNSDDPTNTQVVGKMSSQSASGDFHPNEPGFMYIIDINENYLEKVDISSGQTVDSVSMPVPLIGGIWTVLTIHKTTGEFYAIATDGTQSEIYTVDLQTGATTPVFSTGLDAVISGTFDGNGKMYLFEIAADNIYKLDLPNQTLDYVGAAGFDGNFAQGMAYDPIGDEIYLAAYVDSVGPQLRQLNKSTGFASYITDLPGETTGFGFPGSVSLYDFITISDVYNDPDIEAGDVIFVMGAYTNPETGLLINNYGDLFTDEVFPPQSYLKLSGLVPPENAWNGGLMIVHGTINFQVHDDPYHPVDTLIGQLHVTGIQILVNGTGPDLKENSISPKQKNEFESGSRACDSCKFAVLISGGCDTANNHSKYWENLVALYNFKVDSLGYCKDNVFVHYFKGDRRDDRIPQDRVSKADSATIAASHTEISKRVGKCTRAGKQSTFQKMVTNHGASDGTINLLGNKTLAPSNLKDMQQKIVDSCATTIYDEFVQCYGGYSVSEMATMSTRNKAKIYVNSNADSVTGFSDHNKVHSYLKAKIKALDEGQSYEDAVLAAKMAYDEYLPSVIAWYHARLQEFRNVDTSIYVNPLAAHNYFQNKIQKYTADSAVAANSICKSRMEVLIPFTEYCQWQKFVVPPGGQLVLNFSGGSNNCGNVTVYKEDAQTGEKTKVKVWNWNVPGSNGYQEGNNQRVINNTGDTPCTFWVHNDNNGDAVTMRGSSNGNQNLIESASNGPQFAGTSFGGDDNSSSEFGTINTPEYYYELIDQIPTNLSDLPAYLGQEYVQYFGFSFEINPSDPYWSDMVLHLDVAEVVQPGILGVIHEGSAGSTELQISEPGEYIIPLGDLSFLELGQIQMIVQEGQFSIDSWGIRSFFNVIIPVEQFIDLASGWNGISGFVEPENPFLNQIMFPVMEQFTLMYDDHGNMFWPGQGINTLQIWQPSEGYAVNMQQPTTLPIIGMPVEFPIVVLDEGWNYIPVLVPEPYPVELLFQGFEGFVIAKDIAGTGVYWPQYNVNSLGALMPGHAYAVLSLINGEVSYAGVPFDQTLKEQHEKSAPIDTPWNPVLSAPNSHLIVFNDVAKSFEAGDIIGSFTSDNWCAGIVEILDPQQNFVITTNGQAPDGSTSNGFVEDEIITFKLYRPSTGEIFTLSPTYNPQLNTGDFEMNGMSEVVDLKLSATGISGLHQSDISIYPNPNPGSFSIQGIDELTKVTIYNAFGEVVFMESKADNFNVDLHQQAKGTYIVQITTLEGMFFEKVIVY